MELYVARKLRFVHLLTYIAKLKKKNNYRKRLIAVSRAFSNTWIVVIHPYGNILSFESAKPKSQ